MTNADALLATVIEKPDDDLVRMVYADFIEEAGDPNRAEFIRLQCELARLPEWDRRAAELKSREPVLLARYGRRWHRELPAIKGVTWGEFHRGFVASLEVNDCKTLTRIATKAASVTPLRGITLSKLPRDNFESEPQPWLRVLKLTDRFEFRPAQFQRFLESDFSAHLTELHLRNIGVENAGALAIAGNSRLKHLTKIDFTNCFVGVAGVRALAEAKHLSGLTSLLFNSYGSGYVDDPFVTPAGVEILADSPTFANLTELGLGGNSINADAVRRLLASPRLAKLESLNLSACEGLHADALTGGSGAIRLKSLDYSAWWGGDGRRDSVLRGLARCPELSQLERLSLTHLDIPSAGFEALAGSPVAATLRVLRIRSCQLGAKAMSAFSQGTWPNLHKLDLAHTNLSEGAAKALAKAKGLPVLRSLNLRQTGFKTASAAQLLKAPWFDEIRELDLNGNDLLSAFAHKLAKAPTVRRIQILKLSRNKFGEKATGRLCAADLPELTELELATIPNIGNEAVKGLVSSGRMANLVCLDLSSTGLTGEGLKMLCQAEAPALAKLNLSFNPFRTTGRALASAEWPALRDLYVMSCNLPSSVMEQLVETDYFQNLRILGFYGNTLPTSGPAATKLAQGYWLHGFDPTWTDEDVDDDIND